MIHINLDYLFYTSINNCNSHYFPIFFLFSGSTTRKIIAHRYGSYMVSNYSHFDKSIRSKKIKLKYTNYHLSLEYVSNHQLFFCRPIKFATPSYVSSRSWPWGNRGLQNNLDVVVFFMLPIANIF